MFNDQYGLTQAVLDRRKKKTRRNFTLTLHKGNLTRGDIKEVYPDEVFFNEGIWFFKYDGKVYELPKKNYPFYKVGEIVAIAQRYQDTWKVNPSISNNPYFLKGTKGWSNKMNVRADLMPHQIRITDIQAERLQDISEDDCIAEGVGISKTDNRVGCPFGIPFNYYIKEDTKGYRYTTAREAYTALINKVNGKGTWEKNPWVWVYSFELVK